MNKRHFELAARTALKSRSKFRLGSVLARRTRVISVGWNDMYKSHPIMDRYKERGISYTLGLHSEIHACIGVPTSDLIGAEIYVYRIKRNGSPGLARPCRICTSFLRNMGISMAYFSTDEGYSNLILQ